MKTIISGRRITVRPDLAEYIEKKLLKFDKFFDSSAEATVTVSAVRNMVEVEITIRNGGMIFRGEEISDDPREAVDKIIDVLFRQIRKHKSKLEQRFRADAFEQFQFPEPLADEVEEEFEVVRIKKFIVKPMDVEEAILQMNMLGHEFFMFRDVETNEISVVYKRKNGNYGLLEPSE